MLKKIYYRLFAVIQILIIFVLFTGLPVFGQSNKDFTQEIPSSLESSLHQFKYYISQNLPDSAAYFINRIDLNSIPQEKINEIVFALFTLSEKYHISGNPDMTNHYCSNADSLIKVHNLKIPELECEINYLKGWYCYKRSNIDCAREEFNKALDECDDVSSDSLKVLVLKYLGNIDLILGNLSEASKKYQKSLELELSRPNPLEKIISGLYQNMGIIHARYSEYDSARFYFLRAINMKESIFSADDPSLAIGYLNFSLFLLEIGDLKEALLFINKAEDIFRKNYGPDYFELAPLYLNKGTILFTINDYPEALTYFNLALELNQKYKHPHVNEHTLYSNLGSTYGAMENYEKAIQYNKLALEQNPNEELEVNILNSIAGNYNNKADIVKAEAFFKMAVKKAERLESYPARSSASAYLAYGNYLINSENYQQSLVFFNKALSEFIALYGNKNRRVCESLMNISTYYVNISEYEKALIYAQKSLVAGLKEFNDTSFYQNPDFSQFTTDYVVFSSLFQKAYAFNLFTKYLSNDIKDLKATFETAQLAIRLLEKIKSSLKGEDSKLLLSSKSNSIYDLAVHVSAELYQKTGEIIYLQKSFEYSEKGKAAVLLANSREMEALQVGNIPDDIRMLESSLKTEIAQYQTIIFEETQNLEPDTNKLARIRLAMYKYSMQYDSLTVVLENNYPEYYNLKYNFEVIDIAEIQSSLSDQDAFIEYKLADSILYSYIITKDSASLMKRNVGSYFADKVHQYLSFMNVMPEVTNVKQISQSFAKLGFEIYQDLSLNSPVLIEKERLIVIPDDVLGYLSFDALVCNSIDSDHSGYNNLDYLVYKFAMSYGYSATLYFNRQEKRSSKNKLLAMAPIYEKPSNELAKNEVSGIRELTELLYPLEHTIGEVNNINTIFPGEVLTGIESTEANFKARSNQFKILHFAMHALIDDEDPLTSKLIFDQNNSDTIEDGFLHTYEIYNLNLNAELAVLSACKTGTGKLSKGEGIMSLARGFLYAGVPGIVMTLWAIEDISSANIITQFYQLLKNGESKDVALRNAKLDYLKSANKLQSHPYFWAAYVQIGDKHPVSNNKRNRFYFIGAGVLVLLVIAVFIYRRKR